MSRKLLSLLTAFTIIFGSFAFSIPAIASNEDPEQINYYRLEETASGATPVTDGAGLNLDGPNQIKDEMKLRHGNSYTGGGTVPGTYKIADGTVMPVPAANIKGAANNNAFVKLEYPGTSGSNPNGDPNKNQGIDVGDYKIGKGMTIEGWIYPTGSGGGDVWYNTRIFTMQPAGDFGPGTVWSWLNSDGGVVLGVVGANGSYKQFFSPGGMVKWNQWNYVAITWDRNSEQADFYAKSVDDAALDHKLAYDYTNIGTVPDILPNVNAHASFGYTHLFGLDLGFQGYMDELRLSNYKLQPSELSVIPDVQKKEAYYRFEKTASGTSLITDGASLSLDGASQVKDESDSTNGNPMSGSGSVVGSYESADSSTAGVTVHPAPVEQIKGISGNNFFAKLGYSQKQGIDLGDLKLKDGLTLEGWIYPTGDKDQTYYSGRFVTKRTGWEPGEYWSLINSDGSLIFGVNGTTNFKTWYGSQAKVKFNKWNYISITWQRGSSDVDFYVKPYDNVLVHETRTDTTDIGSFPDSDEHATIGYTPGFDAGLDGYVDEVRVSTFARTKEELLVNDAASRGANHTDQYRFEATSSGITPITDQAPLSLDGVKQIKDDFGLWHGDAFSGNGLDVGAYRSADGTVKPVTIQEMNGALGNNFFAKLDYSSKQQGIDLGAFTIGTGFTFEGWFRPTGSQANAEKDALLIAKRSTPEGGNFWAYLNAEGGVTFKMTGDNGATREWKTSSGHVQWGQWNYIGIATHRDRVDVDFYIKPVGGQLFHETIRSKTNIGLFPDTFDAVSLGYNASLDAGFDGYVDEVRLTNFKRISDELQVSQDTGHLTQDNFVVKITDQGSTNIPTYGSFNRHILESGGVYYASFNDNGDYGHIIQSADQGHTWTDLYATGQTAFSAAPVLIADNSGNLYVIGSNMSAELIFMKFRASDKALIIGPTVIGKLTTKFGAVYSPHDDVIYVHGRIPSLDITTADTHVLKLDTSGNILRDSDVIKSVGTYGTAGQEYWDAQYQSMYADLQGRLHMIYTAYRWPDSTNEWIYDVRKVLYMYSDDGGVSWHKANGNFISTPFNVNDFTNGGTEISKDEEGWRAWGASILADGNDVHILYQVYDNAGYDIYHRYVRLDRNTGAEEQRMPIIPHIEDLHATLVSDPATGKIYISSEVERRPTALVSNDHGDNWSVLSIATRPPENDDYFASTSSQTVTSDGSIIAMTSDWGYTGKRGVVFAKLKVRTKDNVAPVITADEPGRKTGNHYNVDKGPFTVTGHLSEPGTVTVNGVSAATKGDQSFSITIPLNPGMNLITIRATDPAGNAAVPVTYNVVPNNSGK